MNIPRLELCVQKKNRSGVVPDPRRCQGRAYRGRARRKYFLRAGRACFFGVSAEGVRTALFHLIELSACLGRQRLVPVLRNVS